MWLGPRRPGAGGEQDVSSLREICRSPQPVTSIRCGSTNDASPQTTCDAIAGELVLNDLPFGLADVAIIMRAGRSS